MSLKSIFVLDFSSAEKRVDCNTVMIVCFADYLHFHTQRVICTSPRFCACVLESTWLQIPTTTAIRQRYLFYTIFRWNANTSNVIHWCTHAWESGTVPLFCMKGKYILCNLKYYQIINIKNSTSIRNKIKML